MSKIVKPKGKSANKRNGFRIINNDDKETKEEEDDIQNIDELDLINVKQKNQKKQKQQEKNRNIPNKQYAQNISLMEEEQDEQAHPNSAIRHNFKAKIRNKSSSDSEELMKSSSDSVIQKKKQNKRFSANATAKQTNSPMYINMQKNNKQNSLKNEQKIQNNEKIEAKKDKTVETNDKNNKLNQEKYLDQQENQKQQKQNSNIQLEDEPEQQQLGKKKGQNEKENLQNGNYSLQQGQYLINSENKRKLNNSININEQFKPEIFQKINQISRNNKPVSQNNQSQFIEQVIQTITEDMNQQNEKGLYYLNKNNNKLNNSLLGYESDCLSMQPQGANSSPIDSKSISIGNLAVFEIDDSIQSNYSNLLDNDVNNDNNNYIHSEFTYNDDESDNNCLKQKSSQREKNEKRYQKNNNLYQNQEIQSDNYLITNSEKKKQNNRSNINKNNRKLSAFSNQNGSPIQDEIIFENNFNENSMGGSSNKMKNSSPFLKRELNELRGQTVSEFGLKGVNNSSFIKGQSLQDVSSIEEELFEINELPKDKTRVLWIFNSVHFIEKLTNFGHNLEGQEIATQNGKKWTLQMSYSENLQQIECVFTRKNKLDTSKQQMYYAFKFYAISKTEQLIDKTYNGNKTFSPESTSQSFTFPLDIELILEKYQHIIFELTLTPLRIQHYNSKEETNYVGLLNEGQTCYMNSYLQTLFHIKAFVKLVYSIPTEREVESKFPHSFRGYHCTTTELLKSFSWDRSKARIQQDVQEFSCLFIEYLESKAEKIPQLKGQIKHLFQGKIQNYIKCINVDYESVREESYFEISLNLKGCANISESLDDYVKEELLERDNKYDTGDPRYGRQDAKKGIKILELPPVLFFHLKRFQFDYQTGRNMKITDSHEYYEEIDMQKYIANPNSNECYKYNLFAVLVHSGDMSSSGHYYAYIRPNPSENNWFKFNDAIVEKASEKQVFDHSFGGKAFFKGFDKNKKQFVWESSSINSTAYMLVYINQKELNSIIGEIPLTQVPTWVIEQEEQLIQEYLLKQKLSKIVQVRMTSFDLLKKQKQTCAVYFQKLTKRDEQPEVNESIIYKKDVDKSKTYKEFYQDLCAEMGVQLEDIAIWKIDYLPNGFERITNETKKLFTNGSDLIEKAYLKNQTNSINSSSSTSITQIPQPILLIVPISSITFGDNKSIFQIQNGQLEIKKSIVQMNGENRISSQIDQNKYQSLQQGNLMLIIIKNFEYTKEGVKIQFMDYMFFNKDVAFSILYQEITKKKRIDIGAFSIYKEEQYEVTQLSVNTHGNMNIQNVFNSTDCGVLVIAFESKTAKDNNISIDSYYRQLDDQIRVRFISSSSIIPQSSNSLNTNAVTNAILQQSNPINQNNKQQYITDQNYQSSNKSNPFLPGSKNNLNEQSEKKNLDLNDSHINNISLANLIQAEGIQIEKIFLKSTRYSELQISIFKSLKDYFREQLKQYYPQAQQQNMMENEDIYKNQQSSLQVKKSIQNINSQEIEQFLNLDDKFHEYIYFKCKFRKRNIEEIPFFQSPMSEYSLSDLIKHFDNKIVLYFDFSKVLCARDRNQKLVIEYSLYSNTFNKIYPNFVQDIEKTSNFQTLANQLKQQKFFKDFQLAESSQLPPSVPAPSTVKICQLWKDNPNRIEMYFQDSAKLNQIKKNQLIRIEIQREIQESEIFFICHQSTKNGIESFDNPFSFPLSIYKQVKELKNRVVQILTDRSIIFDGKKIELNRDNLNIILYSEYSKYDSKQLQISDSNEKSIKNEIDTDSFKNKCAFLEIQHTNIISSSDSKAIKFDMN